LQNVERVAYEFAVDNYSEGVRYFEVRFAPQLHASIVTEDNFSIEQVIRAVDKGLHRAMEEFNVELLERKMSSDIQECPYDYGIIVSAMRLFTPDMGRYYKSLCAIHSHFTHERIASLASEMLVRVAQDCRVNGVPRIVALDIAGAENGFKNSTHSVAFDLAHSYFLKKTVHAGEGFGPESIFQAVRDLHADRIGHGFHLFR
jgi:adenosine deaminase